MQYSKELKAKALRLSDKIGPKRAAEKLGIDRRTISRWRYKRNCKNGCVKPRTKNEPVLIKTLDKNIADLIEAKKILSRVFNSVGDLL